jgi:hypothetical protein
VIRVRVDDSSIEPSLHAHNGLHMLPNLKILICGVVFGLLLFAVTGAGVLLPDSNTRVGEMPQISRPMMQRMIADEPSQAQFHTMMVARRGGELERLRERAALEVASAFEPTQPDSDLPKPAVIDNPVSDEILAIDVTAPIPQPSEALRVASVTASGARQVVPTEIETDVASDEAKLVQFATNPVQVAALPPTPADLAPPERTPSSLMIPLPPLRPTAKLSNIHRRVLHRIHWAAQAPPDTFGQSLFARPLLPPR